MVIDASRPRHQGLAEGARRLRSSFTSERDLRIRIGALVIDVERRHQQIEAETAAAITELLAAADAEAEVCVASARADLARQKLLAAVQHAESRTGRVGSPEAPASPAAPPAIFSPHAVPALDHPSVPVADPEVATNAVVIDLDERRSLEVG